MKRSHDDMKDERSWCAGVGWNRARDIFKLRYYECPSCFRLFRHWAVFEAHLVHWHNTLLVGLEPKDFVYRPDPDAGMLRLLGDGYFKNLRGLDVENLADIVYSYI